MWACTATASPHKAGKGGRGSGPHGAAACLGGGSRRRFGSWGEGRDRWLRAWAAPGGWRGRAPAPTAAARRTRRRSRGAGSATTPSRAPSGARPTCTAGRRAPRPRPPRTARSTAPRPRSSRRQRQPRSGDPAPRPTRTARGSWAASAARPATSAGRRPTVRRRRRGAAARTPPAAHSTAATHTTQEARLEASARRHPGLPAWRSGAPEAARCQCPRPRSSRALSRRWDRRRHRGGAAHLCR